MFDVEALRVRTPDSRELLRGLLLANDGAVSVAEWSAEPVRADALSSEGAIYSVELRGDLSGYCNCVAWKRSKGRAFCKHMAAVAILWLRHLDVPVRASDLDSELTAGLARLSDSECRDVLAEAAGDSDSVRNRVITGQWRSK